MNNLAHRLLVKPAVEEVLLPELAAVRDELADMAHEYRDVPMLARTHGQPATPTTFGKEMAVYAARLGRAVGEIERAAESLSGKLAGASGTYAAHVAAYPDVDWRAFSREFVTGLGLSHTALATQVNPCDDLAELFDALRARQHDSPRHRPRHLALRQRPLPRATDRRERNRQFDDAPQGQPHRLREQGRQPLEGQLRPHVPRRLRHHLPAPARPLGFDRQAEHRGAFAYCLLGYTKAQDGLGKVVPNEEVMREELESTPEIIGEAVQTILRREGHGDAYERVKALTRGKRVTLDDFRDLFDELDVDEDVREELHALTPAGYTGIAADLADDLD